MTSAKIILDSINLNSDRITSWVLKVHRFCLAEVNTHRMFSRNSASSRAIPVSRIIKEITDDPAIPLSWGKYQKGMQASQELSPEEIVECKKEWLLARDSAIAHAEKLLKLGLHKQVTNRLLEPWMWQTILLTATDFANFFALRAHFAAQPEFQKLAFLMLDAYNQSTPKQLQVGEWHIPFSDQYCEGMDLETKLKVCAARAARVSYKNFEGEIKTEDDIKLCDGLLANGHMSPTEHAAQASAESKYYGNFKGWVQWRKVIPGENRSDPRLKA